MTKKPNHQSNCFNNIAMQCKLFIPTHEYYSFYHATDCKQFCPVNRIIL